MGKIEERAAARERANAIRLEKGFRDSLRPYAERYPDSRYVKCLLQVESPDMASEILIEIPAYDDPELLNTVNAARLNAANPDRIHFAVCLQDDDPEKLKALQAVPNCRIKHYAKADAPGTCAARYECQKLLEDEDYVLHVDAHMRFAKNWDVFWIDQWRRCGHPKAVLSVSGRALTEELRKAPLDSPEFVGNCSRACLMLVPRYFAGTPCSIVVGTRWVDGRTYDPQPGAFMAAGVVFACADLDRQVPVDPHMNFSGDEEPVVVRAWTHGFRFFHPAIECVYHWHDIDRHNSSYRAGSGWSERQRAQVARCEKLLGIGAHDDIDLGGFGCGTESTIADYEAFAGICFKDMTIRRFAAEGRFGGEHTASDLELAPADLDWAERANKSLGRGRDQTVPPDAEAAERDAVNSEWEERLARPMDPAERLGLFRQRLSEDIAYMPKADYLKFVRNIQRPDLTSTILIEIPAYCDPELVPTMKAALANAANPDRIHFAVCLQDDDEEKLAFLNGTPHCRVKHYAKADAPGLYAARYECQKLLAGEDFVLHIDSHMRFARYWDVAIIFSWRQCRDERAILTDYAATCEPEWLGRPLGSDFFVRQAGMYGVQIAGSYFSGGHCDLRFRPNGRFYDLVPRRGAFMSGHCTFGRPALDLEVPCDPGMDFSADEVTMAARYWTHGFNMYQCAPRYIYHLYNREGVYKKSVKSADKVDKSDGLDRKRRQRLRMEKLLGVHDHPGVNLFGFDLGQARSLKDYEAYAGVDFRKCAMRKFCFDGDFLGDHAAGGGEFCDWAAAVEERLGYKARGIGREVPFRADPDALDEFAALCADTHYWPPAALSQALREFVARERRGRR